jgi:chromosome segregation ATPase
MKHMPHHCPPLMAIRNRLENYVVRSTSELLEDLPDDRQRELGELLNDLEGRGERVHEAENRIEELLGRLEQRGAAVAALESEVSELKARVARLRHELEERERLANDRLEAERVRAAERERRLREQLEELEAKPQTDAHVSWFGAQVHTTPRPTESF